MIIYVKRAGFLDFMLESQHQPLSKKMKTAYTSPGEFICLKQI